MSLLCGQFFWSIAENVCQFRIDVAVAIILDDVDARQRMFDQRAVACFTLTESLFCLLALGDVTDGCLDGRLPYQITSRTRTSSQMGVPSFRMT